MPGVFRKLPPLIQRRLLASYAGIPVDDYEAECERLPTLPVHFDDWFAVFRAIGDGDVEALDVLLDLGVDINRVENTLHPEEPVSPLCLAIDRAAGPHAKNGLAMMDLLLAQGADPNLVRPPREGHSKVSPMHAACCLPQALSRLQAKGGLLAPPGAEKWPLLDEWVGQAKSLDNKKRPGALRALDMLIAHGLDPKQNLKGGRGFLASCWGSLGLRPYIPALIAKGFDPYRKRSARAGSFIDFLGSKAQSRRGGPASKMLAQLTAKDLAQSTQRSARALSVGRL